MAGIDMAQAMGPALALARQGRFDEAAAALVGLLMQRPNDAAIRALAGAIALQRGRPAEAVPHLEKALAGKRGDPMVRGDLIEALQQLGLYEKVLALVDMTFLRADKSRVMARIAGACAQAMDRHRDAATYYELVLATDPRDWASWNNLGNALSALKRHDKAIAALDRALKLAPGAQPILINLANALIAAGLREKAETVLAQMIRDFPKDPNPHFSRFELLLADGREEEAQTALQRAADLSPDRGDIQLALGQHAARLGLYGRAAAAFARAETLLPKREDIYVGFAGVLERLSREDELPALHARAAAQGTSPAVLAFIDLMIARREGKGEEAYALLDAARSVLSKDQAAQIEAALLQQLGRHEEAFAIFAKMNAIMAADPSKPRARAKAYRAAITAASARLDAEGLAGWTPYAPPAESPPAPIFLLGFPRSGTTLLDTMLMGDPRVVVLEEESFIAQIADEIAGDDGAALATMTPGAITRARQRYFDLVRAHVTLTPDTILVDKHPMHLAKALTIHRLFPDARFLLALRHPLDAVFSCFMAHFRINDAMANFLDLGDAAALYDAAFGHWEKLRALAGLDMHQVVYENLVVDPEAELRPVFEALELHWPEGGPDHQSAARKRGLVITASYAQITQPLHTRAAGRWRHYTRQLATVMPLLEPWARHFGYLLPQEAEA